MSAGLSRLRIVLVTMGCFNPPTIAHLRLLIEARKAIDDLVPGAFLEGVVSPVGDGYLKFKPTLLPALHRVKMCSLAIEELNKLSGEISYRVSHIEASMKAFSTSDKALDLIREECSKLHSIPEGQTKCLLVCGADLFVSLTRRDLWEEATVENILSNHGLLVLPRPGRPYGVKADTVASCRLVVDGNELLTKYSQNILFADAPVLDISSTYVRNLALKNVSIDFLVPFSVGSYIKEHRLYIKSTL